MFYDFNGPIEAHDLARKIGGATVLSIGTSSPIMIHGISTLKDAKSNELAVLNNKKYINDFIHTKAAVCIVSKDWNLPKSTNLLLHSNPYYAYSQAVKLLYSVKRKVPKHFIAPSAYISTKSRVHDNNCIGHNTVIEEEVAIGEGGIIGSNSVIEYGVKIGKNVRIGNNVTISNSVIGDNVTISSGAIIGQEGFGFATESGKHYTIPHIRKVVIGNNVEIGANTTIDRGSVKDTKIGNGCRIDNLVQIAHNVELGEGSIVVAQVGIAGSVKIGKYCALGGQVGIAGHLNIGDKAQVAAQGGVIQDIPPNQIVGGTPAVPIRDWHRQSIFLRQSIKKRT